VKFSEVRNEQDVWELMTEPAASLIDGVQKIAGDLLVLGGSGKMGKELVGMLQRADRTAGVSRKISVASTFSTAGDMKLLQNLGVECLQGDLSSPEFLRTLPEAPNVIYMMGFKFGSSGDWRRTFHLNSIVPYLVGERYPAARIVVFSSGNPYPHTRPADGGCRETETFQPAGIYGWSIVAREGAFSTTALHYRKQKLAFFRLMYAQHFCYGVLADLADMVLRQQPVSLAMPAVNLVSQRDANHAALAALRYCDNPAWIVNVAGPVYPVKQIVNDLAARMNREPVFIDDEAETALLANDAKCRNLIGSYRDSYDEMISGVANWQMNGGSSWNKPTYFGRVRHDY
jgi:nucleoside-diphosphate-sugar epimerase